MSFIRSDRALAEFQAGKGAVHPGVMFTAVVDMTTDVIKPMEGKLGQVE